MLEIENFRSMEVRHETRHRHPIVCFVPYPVVQHRLSAYGKRDSSENSCNCNVLLIMSMYEDGSPTGTMNFAGTQVAINDAVVDGDHLSCSVDQPSTNNGMTVTYHYDAKVTGDKMTGTPANEAVPAETHAFSAKRQRGN